MKKIMLLFLSVLLLCSLCACHTEEGTGDAMILCDAIPFTLKNAEGRACTYLLGGEFMGDLEIRDLNMASGHPAKLTFEVNASKEYSFSCDSAQRADISFIAENFSYGVRGTGVREITAGVDGLRIQGESAEYQLSASVYFPFCDRFSISGEGCDILLTTSDRSAEISGVEESVLLHIEFFEEVECGLADLTVSTAGGSAHFDFSQLVEGILFVTDGNGTKTVYTVEWQM